MGQLEMCSWLIDFTAMETQFESLGAFSGGGEKTAVLSGGGLWVFLWKVCKGGSNVSF